MDVRIDWEEQFLQRPIRKNSEKHTLTDDGVIYIEEQVQALQWYIDSQTAVFEFATEIHGFQVSLRRLLHQNHPVEDTGDCSGGDCADAEV